MDNTSQSSFKQNDPDNCARYQLLLKTLEQHLRHIYPDSYKTVALDVLNITKHHQLNLTEQTTGKWSEKDILLICYGDSLVENDTPPLQTLHHFVIDKLKSYISTIHILPFYPYSSDDGFSVIDYRQVNQSLGDWNDIKQLSNSFNLMFDLVINHVSRESLWFYDYVGDIKPAADYFIEYPPDTDVSKVTRPRNSPLLVPVNTHRGTRYLWATFSEDQIDLNFSNPQVLLEFIDILLDYKSKGASLIRLDAIAFLWKELGTDCIHLPQTHEVVKLFRTLFNAFYPSSILLTETNVPHSENMSYFGDADEAHMIYQFALPPLLLHALNRGNARHLTQWASDLPILPDNCTYLNFTASHDGIGLRALEGIVSKREIDDMIESMHRFGGFVSMKANATGRDSPYEINISLFDALQGTRRGTDQWQIQRFICSQAIMLAMQGIPAFYIHSLLATQNDLHGVELTGRTRSINRKSWDYKEISHLLESQNTTHHKVFYTLLDLIKLRKDEPCFHPDAEQHVIDISHGIFCLLRASGQRKLLAIHNVTASPQAVTIQNRPELSDKLNWYDIASGSKLESILAYKILKPYEFIWLSNQSG